MKKIVGGLLLIALFLGIFATDAHAKYVSSSDSNNLTVTINVEMPQYTVVFDANGGTGSMSPQTIFSAASHAFSAASRSSVSSAFEKSDSTQSARS